MATPRRQDRRSAASPGGRSAAARWPRPSSVLSLLWNLPVGFSGFGWSWLAAAALEVTLVFALLALVPPLRTGWPGRLAAARWRWRPRSSWRSKIAELALRESLGRPLNPVLDVQLARSLVDLLTETLGGVLGWLSIAGARLAPASGVRRRLGGAARHATGAGSGRFARHATPAASATLIGLFAVQQMAPQALGPRRRCRTTPA